MKLIAILLVAVFVACAGGYAQKISMSKVNVPLTEVFGEIKNLTGLSVIYPPDDLAKTRNVTIVVLDVSVDSVFRICFNDQPVDFGFSLKGQLISVYRIYNSGKAAPPIPKLFLFRGIVKDENGNFIPGVTVSYSRPKGSIVANENGEFEIPGISVGTVLTLTCVGYEPEIITVDSRKPVSVQMNVATKTLDQVILIPYGTSTLRLSTTPINKISGREITRQPVSNPLAALSVGIPGLLVIQSNGLPGTMFRVQLRGQSSIGVEPGRLAFNDPLILIDGIPFAPGNNSIQAISSGTALGGGGISPFAAINPADIESVEIFKDADATAIYGSRGANGVILLTTKKGKMTNEKGERIKPSFNVNVSTGFSQVARQISLLNTPQYLQMRREALQNDNLPVNGITAPDLTVWDTTRNTNFQKLLIGGMAPTTNFQTTFTGGTNKLEYLFSAGHYYTGTVFPGDLSENRTSLHGQFGYRSTDKKLALSFSMLYSSDRNRSITTDLTNSIYTAPNAPVIYDPSGKLNWQENGFPFVNPFAFILRRYDTKIDNTLLSLQFSYRILKGVTLKMNGGYSGIRCDEISTLPAASQNPMQGPDPQGVAYFGNSNIKSWIVEPQVEYKGKFAKGQVTVLVGTTYQRLTSSLENLMGTGYTNDDSLSFRAAAASLDILDQANSTYKYFALFGRISYNLDDQFLVNITGRRDGSSRFGPAKQFGNFGAVGAAWIFSKASFMQNTGNILSYGKLRGSYGITGNDQIGEYKYLAYWSQSQYTYLGNGGLMPSQAANSKYGWEVSKKLEAGLDLGFFNDRLLFFVTYYRNRTGNQLLSYVLPATTGFTNFAAKNFDVVVQNSGFEFMVESRTINKATFSWTSRLALTIPRNELRSFPGLASSRYANAFTTGYSLTAQKVLHFTGVDPATGLFQFEDLNGDNRLTFPDDYKIARNLDPRFYGSIENTIAWKNFQLDISLQGKAQTGYSFLYGIYNSAPPGTPAINQPSVVLNRWQNPGDNAPVQRFSTGTVPAATTAINNFLRSDGKFADASYLRLKNICVRYKFPARWLESAHIKGANIYMQAQNLFTLTGYKGFDPEMTELFTLPPLKTMVIGVEVKF